MSLARKIISDHVDGSDLPAGRIVTASVDHVYIQDGNSPTIARLFAKHGFDRVFDSTKISVFFDHSVLVPNVDIADRLKEARAFCTRMGLKMYEAGAGISHVVAAELGIFQPGNIVLGSDSHTCAGGAVGSLALGMGATDIAAAMVTGHTWLKTPRTLRLRVVGRPHASAAARDVVYFALARHTQAAFLYKSVEWAGDWASDLSADEAGSVASLGVEMGAKCVFLPQPGVGESLLSSDDEEMVLDIDGLPPLVSLPHAPDNLVPIDEAAGQAIEYVFVGSCTNSRFEDIAEVASVLKGRRVDSRVHLIVTPGSREVYLKAIAAGHIESIVAAGGVVAPPGCGACLGTQGSVPASGDQVLTTMNRNFRGRMGNPNASIYLSSPRVAAHTALNGAIPRADELV